MEPTAAELLDQARVALAAGAVDSAWELCRDAVRIGRATGEVAAVADAATLVPTDGIGSWKRRAEQHALCREALALLGDSDPARRARLEAHLALTRNPWTGRGPAPDVAPDDRFLALRVRHAALVNAVHAEQRLALADEVLALPAGGDPEPRAWGTTWRMDALLQLGRRVEADAERMELAALARRLGPVWGWRLAATHAAGALLDGRHDEVPALTAEARRRGERCGVEEAPFLDLVLRSALAVRAGTQLSDVEAEVRRFLADAPFFAKGWHAQILAALGRTEEAREIWRALAPALDALPPDAPEWLVATVGHADLCVLAGDADAAERLYAMLLPVEPLHAVGGGLTPYEGPVALHLGRLARLTGDADRARRHLTDAVGRAEAMYAPYFARAARAELAALGGTEDPLSPREREVARLVAGGASNREIAAALYLSERTVENHVSSVLRKLGLRSRAAVAARMAGHQRKGS